jgi:hypothetical protein
MLALYRQYGHYSILDNHETGLSKKEYESRKAEEIFHFRVQAHFP